MENLKNKTIKIMLADDDADDRELFTETVKETAPQSSLLTFEDGQRLLSYLESDNANQPDVIFLDINMPLLSGKECLKQIKGNSKLKETPVVMFSTSTDENDIYQTFKLGASLFIPKPGSYMEQIDVFRKFFALYHKGKLQDHVMASFVLIPTVSISAGRVRGM